MAQNIAAEAKAEVIGWLKTYYSTRNAVTDSELASSASIVEQAAIKGNWSKVEEDTDEHEDMVEICKDFPHVVFGTFNTALLAAIASQLGYRSNH